MASDKNYVSVWAWIGMLALCAIPCVGWIFIPILAFTGENETRKNHFKAVLILLIVMFGWVIALHAFGLLVVALEFLFERTSSWPRFLRGD